MRVKRGKATAVLHPALLEGDGVVFLPGSERIAHDQSCLVPLVIIIRDSLSISFNEDRSQLSDSPWLQSRGAMFGLEEIPPSHHCRGTQSLEMTRDKDHGGGLLLLLSYKMPTSLDPPDQEGVEDAKGEGEADGG